MSEELRRHRELIQRVEERLRRQQEWIRESQENRRQLEEELMRRQIDVEEREAALDRVREQHRQVMARWRARHNQNRDQQGGQQ
jgi:ribonuclease HI